jgi:hypothetical protein
LGKAGQGLTFKEEPPGNRFISLVELQAVRDRDEFTLKRVADAKNSLHDIEQTHIMVFAYTCLLAANICLVGSDSNLSVSQSLNAFLLNKYSTWSYIIYYIFWGFFVISILFTIAGLDPREQKIYVPQDQGRDRR